MRSYLFVPGDRPERFSKARAAGAGQVILDLEDAVAPDAKARAREAVAHALRADRPVAVRINGAGTPWFDDDLALAAHPGVAAVMQHPRTRSGRAAPGVRQHRLSAGPGHRGRRRRTAPFPLATRAGLAPLRPGSAGRRRMHRTGRHRGVARGEPARPAAGLRCQAVHPPAAGVSVVEAVFAPGAEEIAWARRVVEAAACARGGAVAVDGRMVDRPVLLRAQRLLQ